MSPARAPAPLRRSKLRAHWHQITPVPTDEERRVLLAALELALATEAKQTPASGWSSPQYQDGSSLRPGQRVWTAGPQSESPTMPAFPYPVRRP